MNVKQRLWVAIGLGGALVLGGAGVLGVLLVPAGARTDAGAVLTGTVRQGTVSASVSTTGNVAPVSETAVGFAVPGTIASVAVQPGQQVTAGQTIATIATGTLTGALTDAQATLASDSTALADAQSALAAAEAAPTTSTTTGTARGATTTSASTASSVAQAQTQVSSDQAKATADQTAVTTAQTDLADATLDAPVAGEVLAVNAAVGQSVSASGTTAVATPAATSSGTGSGSGGGAASSSSASGGTSGSSGGSSSGGSSSGVVTIADTAQDVVTTDVPESEVGSLQVGQAASVTYPAVTSVTSTAKVTAIAPVGTSSGGVVTFPVTVTLSALPTGIRYGDTADVSVTTQSSPATALSVPAAAIHSSGSSSYVEVLSGTTTKDVTVTTGVVGTDGTQVSGTGLHAGERISLGTAASTTTTGTGGTGTGAGGAGLGGGGFGGGGYGGGRYGGGRSGGSGTGTGGAGAGAGGAGR